MDREEQVAWAAGLFEGEGTWLARGGSAQAALHSTDADVVERFAEIVGFGKLGWFEPKGGGRVFKGREGFKRARIWRVSNARDVRALIELFMPYLGDRRKTKAEEILKATGEKPLTRSRYQTHCKFGHEFTEENTGWHTSRHATGKVYTTRFCKECRRVRRS